MTQAEVNRAVARATGETVRTIAQLGFGIADQDVVDLDPEPYDFDPQGKTLDWDALSCRSSVRSCSDLQRQGRTSVVRKARRRSPLTAS